MRRSTLFFASLAALQALSCGEGPAGALELPADYQLSRVDNAAVPATICSTTTQVDRITGGGLSLAGDGTYDVSVDYRLSGGQGSVGGSYLDLGTFVAGPGTVALESAVYDSTWQGTVAPSGITLAMALDFSCGIRLFELGFEQ